MLRQPDLARTFEAIAADGPRYLYGGPLGKALVAHVRALGGCLTLADLESVEPVWLDPLVATYRGIDVHTLPPPCEGFQYLLTLRILDGFDLAAHGAQWRRSSGYGVSRHPPRRGHAHRAQQSLARSASRR